MSTNRAGPSKKRPLDLETVACDRAARGVWLVKVPKYLSEIWQKNAGSEIGSLITGQQVIFRNSPTLKTGDKPPVKNIAQASSSKFAPPDDLKPLGKKNQAVPEMPKEHRFIIRNLDNQTMAVLAEDKTHLEDEAEIRSGKLTVEGRVLKRAECQPPATLDYMKMKISQIEKVSQPKNTIKQMDRAEVKFKPKAQHQENLAKEKAKKDNQQRSVKLDRDVVLRDLFRAFEKHQYYRLTDLQRITSQPANYLKEILTTIANYNATQPHKNMWELKPEYRSYGNETATPNEEADGDLDDDME